MKVGHILSRVQTAKYCVLGNIISIRCGVIAVTQFIDKSLDSYLRCLSVSALMCHEAVRVVLEV